MRPLLMAGAALALATSAAAQGGEGTAFRAGPQFVSYTVSGTTTSQIALPMVAVVPITSRFLIDIATAFASTTTSSGGASSTIGGLTDTQVRGNYAIRGDNMVLTIGLNVPTGKATIDNTQVVAAQAIGIDFYTYPVPSYGSGLAGTVGLAFAGTAGDWELGAGASMRKATEYTALSAASANLKYTPGDEYRVRVGGQRAVGSGRLALGLIFSAFGTPKTNDTTTVNTGARAIAQVVYSMPVGSNELFLTLWDLYTGSGKQLSGTAEASNVVDLGVAYGIHRGNVVWEPNLEFRMISQGSASGNLVFPGLRVRIPVGNWAVYPGASAAFGTVVNQSVSGFRASLGVQWSP
ncbi:MAG: hypothetical protein HYX65_11720 [Gemmatimonadetes bacterium]|nr:hypothetical protein [Gemmatimonadota bacterium]